MCGEDVAEPFFVFIQFVVDVEDRPSGVAENDIDSLFDKAFYNDCLLYTSDAADEL